MRLYKKESLEMLSQRSSVKTAAKVFPTTLFLLLLLSRTNAVHAELVVHHHADDNNSVLEQGRGEVVEV